MATLPAAWQEAFRRERENGAPALADPRPERRLARLLAAFIAAGLFFLLVPGTLAGVWNLLGISAGQNPGAASRVWVQAHGHAQLFGWVGTFILGISLHTVPKFRGTRLRSLALGWVILTIWTGALMARWGSAVWNWGWRLAWPISAAAELAVALLVVWQLTAKARRRRFDLSLALIFLGYAGLIAAFAVQLVSVIPAPPAPEIPAARNALLLNLAVWGFCFPAVWGFSLRFLPALLGLRKPRRWAGYAGVAALAGSFLTPAATAVAAIAACVSLRIFEPAARPAKAWFARAAYSWLVISTLLALGAQTPGMTGASRHAFTVGLLGTLILTVGPRILPAFLNSRELRSPRLVPISLVLLSAGCALRVTAEPLVYSGAASFAWTVLPWSAVLELAAVVLFAVNIGATLASPIPAWIVRETVNENLTLYWCVTAYPETRRLLVDAGLRTLARARAVPRGLTLGEAAEAESLDAPALVQVLRNYFARRLARTLIAAAP